MTTTIAIRIKIPTGMTIPKIIPRLFDPLSELDDDEEVGAVEPTADPLIGTPPTSPPELKAFETPLATLATLFADPTFIVTGTLIEPSVI